ncbi:hypothetical protein GCM10023238_35860 [Streptomyces heliomycini]
MARVWDMSGADTVRGRSPKLRFTVPRPWEAQYFLPAATGRCCSRHRWTRTRRARLPDLGPRRRRTAGGGRRDPSALADVRTAVSKDGRLLVVGTSSDPTAAIWDLSDPLGVRRAVIPVTPSAEPESMLSWARERSRPWRRGRGRASTCACGT